MEIGRKYIQLIDGKESPFKGNIFIGKYLGRDPEGWLIFEIKKGVYCYCLSEGEFKEVKRPENS